MPSIMDGVDQKTRLVGRNRLELLLFRLGDRQRFGINVFKVREVIKCPTLTRIPRSHPVICGVTNMRGMTIPVIDLAAAVGKPPLGNQPDSFVVVSEYNRRVQGFLVSKVDRIVNLNWEEIKPPPKGMGSTFLTAATRLGGELVEIIDVEKVMAEVMGWSIDISDEFMAAKENVQADHFVLVADDSAMARKQITRVLEQLEISHTTCNDGREAYEQLLHWAREEPEKLTALDLVISDVEMPEMDGYTLAKHIKDHPDLKHLYVMLHSSLSGVFNETMIKKVGADQFLSKFNSDELAQAILDRMATRRAQADAA